MLQISQYLDFKYFEIIPLVLCFISLATFVKLIIDHFKKDDIAANITNLIKDIKSKITKKTENDESSENSEDAKISENETDKKQIIEKQLEESPTTAAITQRLEGKTKTSFLANILAKFAKINKQKIIDITLMKVIPVLFLAFLFVWTLFSFVPAILNNFFPSDSKQIITIKNHSNQKQTIALIGRIHKSNDWKPIMPYSPTIQGNYLIKLNQNEEITATLRTGRNDIDHLIVANLSRNNVRGITLSVPRNAIVVYASPMQALANQPRISFLAIVLNICLYFTAIVCCVWFFLQEFNKSQYKKTKNIIILSSSCVILAVAFGFVFGWNLQALLYLQPIL